MAVLLADDRDYGRRMTDDKPKKMNARKTYFYYENTIKTNMRYAPVQRQPNGGSHNKWGADFWKFPSAASMNGTHFCRCVYLHIAQIFNHFVVVAVQPKWEKKVCKM